MENRSPWAKQKKTEGCREKAGPVEYPYSRTDIRLNPRRSFSSTIFLNRGKRSLGALGPKQIILVKPETKQVQTPPLL